MILPPITTAFENLSVKASQSGFWPAVQVVRNTQDARIEYIFTEGRSHEYSVRASAYNLRYGVICTDLGPILS
jgi:hypothetical protein